MLDLEMMEDELSYGSLSVNFITCQIHRYLLFHFNIRKKAFDLGNSWFHRHSLEC